MESYLMRFQIVEAKESVSGALNRGAGQAGEVEASDTLRDSQLDGELLEAV